MLIVCNDYQLLKDESFILSGWNELLYELFWPCGWQVKSKMLDSQNDTIRQLKSELLEAKDAARVSLTATKALEVDLSARLDEEVEQVRHLYFQFILKAY